MKLILLSTALALSFGWLNPFAKAVSLPPPLDLNFLSTLPIVAPSLKPNFLTQAQFTSNHNNRSPLRTIVTMKTTQPLINLDNFEQIKAINCLPNAIEVTFDTPQSATDAIFEWTKNSDLVLYLGHEHRCGGQEKISTRSVLGMAVSDYKLSITTKALLPSSIIQECEFFVTHPQTASNLLGNIDKDVKVHIPLNLNFDLTHNKTITPEIKIDTGSGIAIACKDCHTTGSTTLEMKIKTKGLNIVQYALSLEGNLRSNIDLAITTYIPHASVKVQTPVLILPLTPITVPGLFTFGPALSLDLGISAGVLAQNTFQFGFDSYNAFKFDISSEGLTDTPTILHRADPYLTAHPLKTDRGVEMDISAHVIPSFKFGLIVFDQQSVGLSVNFENTVSLSVSSKAASGKSFCPMDTFTTTLHRSHDFIFKVLALPTALAKVGLFQYPIWGTGDLEVPCSYCSKCSKSGRRLLGKGEATTGTSNITVVAERGRKN